MSQIAPRRLTRKSRAAGASRPVYFNLRNILPKSGTFLPGHPVYQRLFKVYIIRHSYAQAPKLNTFLQFLLHTKVNKGIYIISHF